MSNFSSTDPTLISQLAQEAEKSPEPEIKTESPSDSNVMLPGGFITKDGSVVKYAQVRELNGIDEEVVSKSGSVGKALSTILQRGVVSIGTQAVEKEDLDSLLSGDREALLIGIRRVTFGDEAEYLVRCPQCRTELDITVNISSDIPVKNLEDPIQDRTFTYVSKKFGAIVVGLPTGQTQRKIIENFDKTNSELNTILLGGCIKSINGEPSIGATSALTLGMIDRENIINEILARNPGPRLGEVTTTCEACGEDIPMPLSLSDLFRL